MPKGHDDPLCGGRVSLLPGAGAPGVDFTVDHAPERERDYNTRRENVSYITDEAALEAMVAELHAADPQVVALDIETTGGFKPWMGTIRLIQVGIEEPEPRQFVVDCWRVRPMSLIDFLDDASRELVTCNGIFEQEHLAYHYGLKMRNVFDICYGGKILSKKLYGPKRKIDNSYRGLMRRFVLKRIAKTQQTSEWDNPTLTRHQIKYAAQDVSGPLDVRRGMLRELIDHDLVASVREDCDARIGRAWDRVEIYGDQRADQVDRVLRSLDHAKDIAELDRLLEIERQLTLPHEVRVRVRRQIHEAMDDLLTAA